MARETLRQIADRLEPGVQQAFLDSVALIRSDAIVGLITEAIAAGNIERAIGLLNLDRAHFASLDRGLTAAYQEAGDIMTAARVAKARASGVQIRAAFDARNERAERFLARQSSRLITEIVEDQRVGVRTMLSENMQRGTAPRRTALDLVGRINKATGKREGGIIGLHSRDSQASARAFEELLADPSTKSGKAQLRNYLRRKTRDKRFDRTIRKAIETGSPVPRDRVRGMIIGMENNMLKNRGEMIARTELQESVHAAQKEGIDQLIDEGKVSRENVKAKWDTADDGDQRDSHDAMDGQVRQHGDPFVSGLGNRLLHPGDRSQGAPGEDIINCRCTLRPDIDFLAEAAARERAAA